MPLEMQAFKLPFCYIFAISFIQIVVLEGSGGGPTKLVAEKLQKALLGLNPLKSDKPDKN